MLFYHHEKKGWWALTTLILCLVVLPQQFLKSRNDFFLLPAVILPDTSDILPPATPVRIELNGADSNTLIRIKGIGPYYAHRILSFRKRLGGFYAVSQLKELKMTYFSMEKADSVFCVDRSRIRKRDLNTLSFKEILHHPYLEYEDVVLIFQAKRQYGKVAFDTLQNRKVLPFYKLRKIKPYFR